MEIKAQRGLRTTQSRIARDRAGPGVQPWAPWTGHRVFSIFCCRSGLSEVARNLYGGDKPFESWNPMHSDLSLQSKLLTVLIPYTIHFLHLRFVELLTFHVIRSNFLKLWSTSYTAVSLMVPSWAITEPRCCGHLFVCSTSSLPLVTGPFSLQNFPLSLQVFLVGLPIAAVNLLAHHIIPQGHNWTRTGHMLKPGQAGSSLGFYIRM